MSAEFAPLDPEALERGGAEWDIGREIQVWNRVASTNDIALQAASRQRHGLVILAEEQTQGRGRLGRPWVAPRGSGVLMSIVLDPPPVLHAPPVLVCLTAVAVAEGLAPFVTDSVEIKWPNDLYVKGRKLGGILVEKNVGLVIGVGVNVHAHPPDDGPRRATSLRQCAGKRELDRTAIVLALLERLNARYREACQADISHIVRAWQQRCAFLGECVEVELRDEVATGTLREIDPLGSLLLQEGPCRARRIPVTSVVALRPIERGESLSS